MGIALALAAGSRPVPRHRSLGGAGAVMAVILVVALIGGGLFVDPSTARILASHGTVVSSAEDDIASVQAGSLNGRASCG
jgi:hypothetical protein